MLYVSVLMLIGLQGVVSYPGGAPSSACVYLLPQHGYPNLLPQTSPSPFKLVISSATYSPGQQLEVAISSDLPPFSGWLLQMRRVDNNMTVGQFVTSPEGSRIVSCNGPNNSLTHANSYIFANKTLIAKWLAPQEDLGNLILMGTILKDYSTFWGPLKSNQIVFTPADAQETNTTTTPMPISSTTSSVTTLEPPTVDTKTTAAPTTTTTTTTSRPTTSPPTTSRPTTSPSVTFQPTTSQPTTATTNSTTKAPTTISTTTLRPTAIKSTTASPTTSPPTTTETTTSKPTTSSSTTTSRTTTTTTASTTKTSRAPSLQTTTQIPPPKQNSSGTAETSDKSSHGQDNGCPSFSVPSLLLSVILLCLHWAQ